LNLDFIAASPEEPERIADLARIGSDPHEFSGLWSASDQPIDWPNEQQKETKTIQKQSTE
jgi:hypothetical protein